jgi:small subunit ribosomal protein S21
MKRKMGYQNNKRVAIGGGLKVVVGDMPFNVAMKKFKQKVDDAGLLEEVKERMFYEKPTTVRKKKAGAARARWRKKLRDQELPKKLY